MVHYDHHSSNHHNLILQKGERGTKKKRLSLHLLSREENFPNMPPLQLISQKEVGHRHATGPAKGNGSERDGLGFTPRYWIF